MSVAPSIVDAIRNARLKAYKEVPRDILAHYRDEESERKNYVGRPLLELLQNIEDALAMAEKSTEGAALIELSGNCLYVANQGAPFSERGLEALCDRSISPKRGKGLIGNKGIGFKATLNWTESPRVFSGPILAEFRRDDALAAIKKAITPEALASLRDEHMWSEGQVPLLRLPSAATPTEREQALLKRWTTVLSFPLKASAVSEVYRSLQEFEVGSLVFLRRLSYVRVVVDGHVRDIRAKRADIDEVTTNVEVTESRERGGRFHSFRVFRKPIKQRPLDAEELGGAEVAWAYPIGLVPGAKAKNSFVYNFFPTKQRAPILSVLAHGTFLLTPDRNHYREDDPEFHKALGKGFASLLRNKVIPSLVADYGPRCLEFLRPTGKPSSEGTEALLWQECFDAVSQTAFVPTLRKVPASPRALKLWENGLDSFTETGNRLVVTENLPERAWQEGVYHDALCSLGATPLAPSAYPEILRNWAAETVDDSLRCLMLLGASDAALGDNFTLHIQFFIQATKIRFMLTREGRARNVSDTRPLFRNLPKTLLLPDWMELDVLHESLAELVEARSNATQLPFIEKVYKTIHDYSRESFAKLAISPTLKLKNKDDKWWSANGDRVLDLLKNAGYSANNEIAASDNVRRELSSLVRVPCTDGRWQPGWQVYAGADWDGPFDSSVTTKLKNRALLASPDSFGSSTSSDALRPILQYVGVSWLPKLIGERLERKETPLPLEKYFGDSNLSAGWKSYCDSFKSKLKEDDDRLAMQNKEVSYHRVQEAWGLEGLEMAVARFKSNSERLRYLKECWVHCHDENLLNVVVRRYGSLGGARHFFMLSGFESFVAWQLANLAVFAPGKNALLAKETVPVASCFLQQPRQRKWMQWLALLEIEEDNDVRQAELHTFALQLRARKSLEQVSAPEWLDWLTSLRARLSAGAAIQKAELRGMLEDMGHQLASSFPFPDSFELPCISGPEEHIAFVKARELYVMDELRLLSLKDAILSAGAPLLVSELADGKRLASCFNVKERQLSEAVTLAVLPTPDNEEGATQLDHMVNWKPEILALLEHPNHRTQVEELTAEWPKFRALSQLQASVQLGDLDLGVHDMPFVLVDEDREIFVDVENLWENVAAALFARLGRKDTSDQQALIRLLEKASGEDPENQVQRVLHWMGISEDTVNRWTELVDQGEESLVEDVPVILVPGPGVNETANPVPTATGDTTGVAEAAKSESSGSTAMATSAAKEKKDATSTLAPTSTTANDHAPEAVVSKTPRDRRDARGGWARQTSKSTSGMSGTHNQFDESTAGEVAPNDLRRIRGLEAEGWLRDAIQEWLPEGWNLRKKGGGSLPFDIAIQAGKVTCFIDSKTDGPEFYLSEREAEFAKQQPEHYFIALVGPAGPDTSRTVRWLFDPMNQCREWTVAGRWSFPDRPHGGIVVPWGVPNQRPTQPEGTASFSFVIRVPEDATFPKGKEDLHLRLGVV